MKNFSDATVIKPTLTLDVVLRVKPVGTVPTYLQINDASWKITVSKEEIFTHKVNLIEPIDIQIQITRKHPEALEIELEIDGNKIIPLYQEHLGVSSYIDSDDVWQIKITNFYAWFHNVTGQGWII